MFYIFPLLKEPLQLFLVSQFRSIAYCMQAGNLKWKSLCMYQHTTNYKKGHLTANIMLFVLFYKKCISTINLHRKFLHVGTICILAGMISIPAGKILEDEKLIYNIRFVFIWMLCIFNLHHKTSYESMICILMGMISIRLYTCGNVFYTHRCNVYACMHDLYTHWRYLALNIFIHISEFITCKNTFLPQSEFSPAGQIFTLRAPIFTVVINVWPCANRAMVTNNLTAVIEVALIDIELVECFLYIYNYFNSSNLKWSHE